MNNLALLVFPSAFADINALVKAITKIPGVKDISFEGSSLVVCYAADPVKLAARLKMLYGVKKVAVAKKVKNEFTELCNAIVHVGKKVILPNERFFVKVLLLTGGKEQGVSAACRGYVDRDVEFASSGMLAAELADINARPAKIESEADRIILAVAGEKESAYVCIQAEKGSGGLAPGSNGKAICSIYNTNPLSVISCFLSAKAGLIPEIVILYSDGKDELYENIKLVKTLDSKLGIKEQVLWAVPVDVPDTRDEKIRLLLKDKIAAMLLMHISDVKTVVLPLTISIHPMWFVESVMQNVMAAGKILFAPLILFSDELDTYADHLGLRAKISDLHFAEAARMTKNRFQTYNNLISMSVNSSMKHAKKLKLKIGSDNLQDVIDSI